MADGELRAEQSQVGEMLHGRLPGPTLRVFLLICRFEDMHVQPDTIGLGIIPQGVQGVIRAPVQVRRGELNTRALTALPAFPEIRKQRQIISERNGLATQISGDVWSKARWQALHKSLISFVDQPIL